MAKRNEMADNLNAALDRNVDNFLAGRLTYEQFTELNAATWNIINSAGASKAVNDMILRDERRNR